MKKYVVTLTAAERDELSGLVSRGKAEVCRLKHAQVLLKADASAAGPGWPDERIAEGVGVGTASVERVRRRFVEEGLERALSPYRKGQRLYARALDGEAEGSPDRPGLLAAASRTGALDAAPVGQPHG